MTTLFALSQEGLGKATRMRQSDSSSTLQRALALLWQLYSEPRGLTASELAERLGTQRTALYRLLRPFLREQFIRRDARKRYYLGFGITALARAVAEPVEGVVRLPLQQLADASACTAILVADTDGILVTIASAQPATPGIHLAIPNGFVHDEASDLRQVVAATRAGIESVEGVQRDLHFALAEAPTHGSTAAVLVRVPNIGTDAFLALVSVSQLDRSTARRLLADAAEKLVSAI